MKKLAVTKGQLLDIPVIVTKDRTMLPGVLAHIDIVEHKSYEAFKTAMAGDKRILLAALERESDTVGIEDLYSHATIALIKQAIKTGENNYRIMVEGLQRARIYSEYDMEGRDYLRLVVEPEPEELAKEIWETPAYRGKLEVIREEFDTLSKLSGKIPKEYVTRIMKSPNLYEDIWKLVNILSVSGDKRQELYELEDTGLLLDEIAVLINNEMKSVP